jgi:hypothetical protein
MIVPEGTRKLAAGATATGAWDVESEGEGEEEAGESEEVAGDGEAGESEEVAGDGVGEEVVQAPTTSATANIMIMVTADLLNFICCPP